MSDNLRDRISAAQKQVWAEIHGQDARRTYSVSEVKKLIYSFDNAISDALKLATTDDDAVERAAKALADHELSDWWASLSERGRTTYRDTARIVLTAALGDDRAC